MIEVNNMTLHYPNGKGVFDLNFTIQKGGVIGYLGPNGAGKTTTIRALLGFMQPNKGSCSIAGIDCFTDSVNIRKKLGYIPGEISFMENMSGSEFLKLMHGLRGNSEASRKDELCEMFGLDPSDKIKRFSKGMKQKLGIVTAFMNDPDILILDEPSSGLDPLMQSRFIDLILSEKATGKTILMSSHIFEEVERTCDDIIIIREGRILNQSDVATLRTSQQKKFILTLNDCAAGIKAFKAEGFSPRQGTGGSLEISVFGNSLNNFFKVLSTQDVLDFSAGDQSLENLFMKYYNKEEGE